MTNLIFTSQQYKELKRHLFPGDDLEALAFCLARQIKHEDGKRFLVTDIFLIPHELCEREADLLTWDTKDVVDIWDQAERDGKSVIKIHSHPGGLAAFSRQDDRSDFGLFPSIYRWCKSDCEHASVVFTPDFAVARILDKGNNAKPIDNVWVVGEELKLFPYRPATKLMGFDESTYAVLKKIKIGVVGCSGTGSWIIELAGRNEAGVLGLCEFDITKLHNLNRIVNAKKRDIGKNKARVAEQAVKEMGLGTVVRVSELPLHTKGSVELLKGCDLIIGCTDSIFARHLLNLVCTYYLIPLFDIGVHIQSKDHQIKNVASGWEYIYPGGSSLQSRGIYTAAELANETYQLRSPEHFERLKEDGYVRGQAVSRPAVSPINGVAATSCFEEIQARLLGYRNSRVKQPASKVYCGKSDEWFVKHESAFEKDNFLSGKVGLGDVFFENEAHLLFGDTSFFESENNLSSAAEPVATVEIN